MTVTYIRLRSAIPVDSNLLLHWKNDPVAVAQSFSLRKVVRKEHEAWFGVRWNHPDYLFYLAETIDARPVGYVRYNYNSESATCSLYIDPVWRCQGLGTALNLAGAACCFERWPVPAIVARIKIDNTASRKAYERAGYKYAKIEVYRGFDTITLTLLREEATQNSDIPYNLDTKTTLCT